MREYYPIFLNLEGHTCVVVGGGEVAERKARALLESGGRVRVVSPRLSRGIKALAKRGVVEVAARPFGPSDLDGAFLVIAATSDAGVNRLVASEAEGRGLLVNVVDVPSLGNFIVPSIVRQGGLSIAISTSGKSPALARKLRLELEKTLVPSYAMLLEIVAEVRNDFKSRGKRLPARAWQECLNEDLIGLVGRGETELARQRLTNTLEKWGRPG